MAPTQYVWVAWTANTTAATTVTSNVVWPLWCNQGTTASSTTVIWQGWVDQTGMVVSNVSNLGYREPTPEEREQQRREAAQRAQRVAQARERARALLLDILDEAQRNEYERDGHFHVTTRDGERVYRLKPGTPPRRIKGEDGLRYSYCIHPVEAFPAEDTAAALKLMLETDEAAFLRTANATREYTRA